MATYTSLPTTDIKNIAANYGIKVNEFIPVEGGNSNSNYRIKTNKSDYILTLAEEKSLPEVQKLIALLRWLKKHGFITSEVCSTLSGNTVTQYKGKPVFLKKWIKGTVYDEVNNEKLKQIGFTIAKLHQIPAPDFLPTMHPYGIQVFETVFEKGIDRKYESWLAEQTRLLLKNLPEELPRGLIHGDIFFDNVLFENDKMKAIIDFEEACQYYLIFDLGMGILGLCQSNGTIDLSKAKALIKGYEQVRPLELSEKKLLPLFIKYAAVATSWWRFWKYNIHTPNPASRNKHREMVRIANEIKLSSYL